MATLTRDQHLAVAQNEINELKQKLTERDSAYQDLEYECNFHVIKSAELMEIVEAKDPDEMRKHLIVKSEQNAGLTVQVQELRHHLNNATGKIETLTVDLRLSTDTVQNLATERKSHQRMLVELSDVVRALGNISIGYEKANTQTSKWLSPDLKLENIKRKIEAIEEDRQWQIQEKESLITAIESRDDQIFSLQRENLRVEAIDQDRHQLIEENTALREECASKGSKIEALEHLFRDLNNNRTEDGKDSSIPKNVTCETRQINVTTEESEVTEVISCNDGSTEVVLTTNSISKITDHDTSDDSTFSSLEEPEAEKAEDIKKTRVKLAVLKDKYSQLQTEHESTMEQRSNLEKQLKQSRKKGDITKRKLDIREGLLRDVIYQYKELQTDHDEATAKMTEMEHRMENRFQDNHRDPKQKGGKSKNNHKLRQAGEDPLEESPTFETATACSASSYLSCSTIDAKAVHEEDGSSICGVEIQYFDESMMDEFKRLKSECARLEHEYDDAVGLINSLEEEITAGQKEVKTAQQTRKEREQDLLHANLENVQLKEDNKSALENLARVEEALKFAQLQAKEARGKQKQREQDLWDVIDEYKKLSVEKDETQANLKGVERELHLSKKQITRRDVIYDYMKLQQDYDDALTKIETLERQLQLAKKGAACNKEEAKSTRKRMAGCHFHYKQLQEQYNEALSERADAERLLKSAKKETELRKKQEESWTEKVIHIREKRKQSEEANKQLREENSELKTYCDDLLELCSKSLETIV